MMRFDAHLHTTRHSPDSDMDPFAMVRQAQAVGLDGVVITEHDWLWSEAELEPLRRAAPGLVVLAGIEVSALDGHFLVYGISDPFALSRGIGVAELCRKVHEQGGAVVAAHPFRWGQPFDEILEEERPDLDGLEMMSSNMDAECRKLTAAIQEKTGLATLGNSDAHRAEVLGACFTEFDVDIRMSQDFVEAIKARRAKAKDRSTPLFD